VSKENMKLWESTPEKTDPKALKKRHDGLTGIDAYYQIRLGTELWGAFGRAWGVKDERYTIMETMGMGLYTAILYYPDGEIPIHSDDEIIFRIGKREGKYNADWCKKCATDALTKGLSMIGFSRDIFLMKFADNKSMTEPGIVTMSKETQLATVRTELEKIAKITGNYTKWLDGKVLMACDNVKADAMEKDKPAEYVKTILARLETVVSDIEIEAIV